MCIDVGPFLAMAGLADSLPFFWQSHQSRQTEGGVAQRGREVLDICSPKEFKVRGFALPFSVNNQNLIARKSVPSICQSISIRSNPIL
jgi:hypothetical protein